VQVVHLDAASHRPRLLRIAYRMLGTTADAEEVVQEAYLRLHTSAPRRVDNTQAWLTAVTTRLAIDRFRRLRRERLRYTGPWLPEPWIEPHAETPESAVERTSQLSYGLLLLLERLTAPERAAFVLHDGFDVGYDDLARILRRSAAACRQLVHRARTRAARPLRRFEVDRPAHRAMLAAFLEAIQRSDLEALIDMLAPDAVYYGDGGGNVQAALKPLQGSRAVARFLIGISRAHAAGVGGHLLSFDGGVGIALTLNGMVMSVLLIDAAAQRIAALYNVQNPAKLTGTRRAVVGTDRGCRISPMPQ
jgi:RNA polymerase sigma-70 factor (ECF subfamily)